MVPDSGQIKYLVLNFIYKYNRYLVNATSTNPPDITEYDCHGAKPVLVPTGWMDIPYAWHPATVEIGIYRIGELFILCKYHQLLPHRQRQ